MDFKQIASPLVSIGEAATQGSYVLRMVVSQNLCIPFGRFKRGKLIDVQVGDYLYIGSAMAMRGATCLARRLVRHATRTSEGSPHAIRATMLSEFPTIGLADIDLQPPAGKTLRWNVDHLLDAEATELVSAYMVRSSYYLEPAIGDMLEADPHTVVFERGLGANDRPGSTYLLRVEADEDWWRALPGRLELLKDSVLCPVA